MSRRPEVSIVIRTRNEERWIGHCLRRLAAQTLRDYEIILVDNASTDKTVERALAVCPKTKLVRLSKFRPGHAINEGIRASSGSYIACLSAHCLPAEDDWLERLRLNFDNPKLAGVYGRQIPMRFTSAQDKRDLVITFGLDRRVQKQDPFFHNANSMFSREVWERFPFAEDVTNIEDRIWAKEVLDAGYYIVYEPKAAVYHHHGIHQSNDARRANSVVRVMEESGAVGLEYFDPIDVSKLKTVAVLPVQRTLGDIGASETLLLLEHAVSAVQSSRFISRLIVSTSDRDVAAAAATLGCAVPRLRPSRLSREGVRIDRVLQYELEELEKGGDYPDLVVSLEITHPFRPPGLFDRLIEGIVSSNVDAVIAGHAEFRPCWKKDGGSFHRLDKYLINRREREPLHVGLPALGCVSLPHAVRTGSRLGEETAIVELEDPLSMLEVRTQAGLEHIRKLMDTWPHRSSTSRQPAEVARLGSMSQRD
jgi:GT2 family glycosyltransferase